MGGLEAYICAGNDRYRPQHLQDRRRLWPAGTVADYNAERRDGSEAHEYTNRHYPGWPVDGVWLPHATGPTLPQRHAEVGLAKFLRSRLQYRTSKRFRHNAGLRFAGRVRNHRRSCRSLLAVHLLYFRLDLRSPLPRTSLMSAK